jgi:hypothetical protein
VGLVRQQLPDVAAVERVHELEPDGVNHGERGGNNKELHDDHEGA